MIIVLNNHYYITIYKLECAGELAITSYALSWVYLMGYTTCPPEAVYFRRIITWFLQTIILSCKNLIGWLAKSSMKIVSWHFICVFAWWFRLVLQTNRSSPLVRARAVHVRLATTTCNENGLTWTMWWALESFSASWVMAEQHAVCMTVGRHKQASIIAIASFLSLSPRF